MTKATREFWEWLERRLNEDSIDMDNFIDSYIRDVAERAYLKGRRDERKRHE